MRDPDIQTPADWTALFGQLVPIPRSREASRPQEEDGPAARGHTKASVLTGWWNGTHVPPTGVRGGLQPHAGAEFVWINSGRMRVSSNSHTNLMHLKARAPGPSAGRSDGPSEAETQKHVSGLKEDTRLTEEFLPHPTPRPVLFIGDHWEGERERERSRGRR